MQSGGRILQSQRFLLSGILSVHNTPEGWQPKLRKMVKESTAYGGVGMLNQRSIRVNKVYFSNLAWRARGTVSKSFIAILHLRTLYKSIDGGVGMRAVTVNVFNLIGWGQTPFWECWFSMKAFPYQQCQLVSFKTNVKPVLPISTPYSSHPLHPPPPYNPPPPLPTLHIILAHQSKSTIILSYLVHAPQTDDRHN